MQRILQINIAGRVLPIEEDAYNILKDYISSLERQFAGEDGKEILEDIENRIAELFSIRLQGGAPAIDRSDVQKVMDTLGAASDLHDGPAGSNSNYNSSQGSRQNTYNPNWQRGYSRSQQRLTRDPYDKVIGGVCSGLGHYFDIDPVILRLIMAVLFLVFGIGLIAYIIAWAVIPAARSREELYGGQPMTFHDISRNMQEELEDLKRRGEQMSRDLKDFFSKKK
jgi:phage shock protein C